MNKQNIVLVIVVALLAGGLVFTGSLLNRTKVVQVDNSGRPVGAVSSALNVGNELGINGIQRQVVQGSFIDATTTFIGFLNPTAATATISRAVFKQTGVATTTATYYCGTSYKTSGDPTRATFTIASSQATSTGWGTLIYVGSSTATNLATLTIDPNEYVLCYANTSGIGTDAGITNANNTFDGTFWFELLFGR